jgi:hypothetical protein
MPAPILLIATLLFGQVPDSGTRHDRHTAYLELAASVNSGYPDVFRPQAEAMLKVRGWPVFASVRAGVGISDWDGRPSVGGLFQGALHWTRDGDASWSLRIGIIDAERLFHDAPPESYRDSAGVVHDLLPLVPVIRGSQIALERSAFFDPSSSVGWRLSLGAAIASVGWVRDDIWEGTRKTVVVPVVELGIFRTFF